MSSRGFPFASTIVAALFCAGFAFAAEPDPNAIIQKSVDANQRDYEAAPHFSHKETDNTGTGPKTYEVTMIYGSPYRRLIAVGGEPLSSSAEQAEQTKQQKETASRKAESPSARQKRIAAYVKGRKRDHIMMDQLTKAFNFKLVGEESLDSFKVYKLSATPRPDYDPPNLQSQVLPGMEGQLWIDQATYQWVKIIAKVIQPVSIEGFLAQVQPGTQFELEKMPVGEGIWLPKHFAMHSQAKVLFLFNRSSQENDTFSDYKRVY